MIFICYWCVFVWFALCCVMSRYECDVEKGVHWVFFCSKWLNFNVKLPLLVVFQVIPLGFPCTNDYIVLFLGDSDDKDRYPIVFYSAICMQVYGVIK